MHYSDLYYEDILEIMPCIPNLNRLRDKRILITGATGLICSAIVDCLWLLNKRFGYSIQIYIAVRSREKAEQRFGELLSKGELNYIEYNAVEPLNVDIHFDYIIHGASPANPSLYALKPVETMMANIYGTANLLDYSRQNDVCRFLFISSSEVYGQKNSQLPYGSKDYGYVDILNPRSCYPSAKRACETLCASYLHEYGVDSVIVRPGHIYGPTAGKADTRISSIFFYDAIEGRELILKSDGLQIRSYCYVMDCVSALLTVLLNGKAGSAYNISNPNSIVTIRDLSEKIAEKTGRRVIFANPSDAERKSFNLMSNSSLNSDSLQELGWTGKFDLDTGVEHTVAILKGV